MCLPLNGRIAIIDDQFDQALPIINVLSKNKQACTYYSGDLQFLPNQDEVPNDIRLLFLDINLIDNAEHTDKEIKGRLVPVLKRVIPENNHPYLLVYWSRHEKDKHIIEDIFTNDLPTRKPIAFTSAIKSDYFDLAGSFIANEDAIQQLMQLPNYLLNDHNSYRYLLEWENLIHNASNNTIKEIFDGTLEQRSNWTNNANYILNKISLAYLGEHYNICPLEEKIKGSYMGFMSVFNDTFEKDIYNHNIPNPQTLDVDREKKLNVDISLINEKLNVSRSNNNISNTPGNVFELEEPSGFQADFFIKLVSKFLVTYKTKELHKEITDEDLKKISNIEFKRIKDELKKSSIKIAVVVTPVCDFSQKKQVADKIIKGVIIPAEYLEYIDRNSEALYVIPFSFKYNNRSSVIILDFRYLTSIDISSIKINLLFRFRTDLLSEIQSRLARHVNRQGILSINEH
jgi:hypothetical protein